VIGLDSNVLLRYLAQDDPTQSPKATKIIEGLSADEPGHLTHIALAEIAWVLARAYKEPERSIANIFAQLLRSRSIVVSDEAYVVHALRAASEGEATFADALIGALCFRAGCSKVVTFDEGASRLPGFELI